MATTKVILGRSGRASNSSYGLPCFGVCGRRRGQSRGCLQRRSAVTYPHQAPTRRDMPPNVLATRRILSIFRQGSTDTRALVYMFPRGASSLPGTWAVLQSRRLLFLNNAIFPVLTSLVSNQTQVYWLLNCPEPFVLWKICILPSNQTPLSPSGYPPTPSRSSKSSQTRTSISLCELHVSFSQSSCSKSNPPLSERSPLVNLAPSKQIKFSVDLTTLPSRSRRRQKAKPENYG